MPLSDENAKKRALSRQVFVSYAASDDMVDAQIWENFCTIKRQNENLSGVEVENALIARGYNLNDLDDKFANLIHGTTKAGSTSSGSIGGGVVGGVRGVITMPRILGLFFVVSMALTKLNWGVPVQIALIGVLALLAVGLISMVLTKVNWSVPEQIALIGVLALLAVGLIVLMAVLPQTGVRYVRMAAPGGVIIEVHQKADALNDKQGASK